MRLIALTAVLCLWTASAMAEDLRSAFYALPKPERIEIQTELAALGLYGGEIDGLWGPGTAGALATAEASLAWEGYRTTAEESGVVTRSAALWSYVADPDFRASLPEWR